MLFLVGAALAGAALTLSGFTPANPTAGERATFSVTIRNSGQTATNWSLSGQTQNAAGTKEGDLTTAGGSLAGGATVPATVQMAGGIGTQYDPVTNPGGLPATLDVLLVLTDTDTGAESVYLLRAAVNVPPAPVPTPANLQITAVTVGVAS
ncbi:MAG: hypothetical protein ACYCT1_08475 [Steroidobacteraceae bacterium]